MIVKLTPADTLDGQPDEPVYLNSAQMISMQRMRARKVTRVVMQNAPSYFVTETPEEIYTHLNWMAE